MRTVIISLWRNDEHRGIRERAHRMLSKVSTRSELRWVWVVGDSTDATEDILEEIAARDPRVKVLSGDTGIEEPGLRIRRQSLTFNAGLDDVGPEDTYILHHESDLVSPPDVVDIFINSGFCPVAGWPILAVEDPPVFYDTWAYRGMDLRKFINHPPYHPEYRSDRPFEVSSVGSCWMYWAEDIYRHGVRCYDWGVVELSQKFRALGRRIMVLPQVIIEQPVATWEPHAHLS